MKSTQLTSLRTWSRYMLLGTLACLVSARLPQVQDGVPGQAYASNQNQGAERFATVDIYIDPGRSDLGAWQIQLEDPGGHCTIVGVEGGEHAAFREAPYYDPAALQGGLILLAAFQTEGPLPAGRTRVARLHLQVQGSARPTFSTQLIVAADGTGEPIEALVELMP